MKLLNLLIILLCFSAHAEMLKEPLRLGQSAAFSGTSEALGIELWRGAQAYFQMLNESGGVHGQKIEVVTLDDRYNGELTLPNTANLVEEKKVFALFGYVGTPTIVKALPLIQTYRQEEIFLFSNFTGAQPQREPPYLDLVYNIRASYRDETEAIVDRLNKIGHTKFALFIQDDAYGRSGADGVQRALQKRKLPRANEVLYRRGTAFHDSMKAQSEILKKSGAEVVVCVSSYEASAALIRDLRDIGFSGPIANLSFVGASKLLEILIEHEEKTGKKLTDKLLNSQVVPVFDDLSYPLVREYRQAIDQLKTPKPDLASQDYKPAPYSFSSLEGFLNAKIFAEILKKTKTPVTRKNFKIAAAKLKNFDAGMGKENLISFVNNQALHQVFMTTIENRKYVSVEKWELFK